MIQGKTYTVHIGSNLDILPTLPDNSVDSIVTDPPYGLSDNKYIDKTLVRWISGERDFIPDGKGFMGKSWDSFVPPPALWDECLRVLKPGGHLLAFFGSRTQDIGALSIRLAGFEIRDSIAWMYGSGFPKSLDISKAIDKRGGVTAEQSEFAKALQNAKNKTSLTIADLNEILGRRTSNLWSHFVGDVQPQLPSVENYWKLKGVLPLEDKWDSWFQAEAEREVIGQKEWSNSANHFVPGKNHADRVNLDITSPSTPEAQQWEGWGTALKPAHEPIVVARKPLIGTVAENVLEHGTGGMNIDGSRIGTTDNLNGGAYAAEGQKRNDGWGMQRGEAGEYEQPQGRWPSNVILDPYTAELLDEQTGNLKSGDLKPYVQASTGNGVNVMNSKKKTTYWAGDSGGASRFFYVAKASKRDRNEGLEELPEKPAGSLNMRTDEHSIANGMETQPAKNFHPTVKPTDLMRYLVKLVTPPGGTVLDPFTGSGSTGKAAILEGFRFIGCELTEDYIPIIEGRLAHAERLVAEQKEKEDEALF